MGFVLNPNPLPLHGQLPRRLPRGLQERRRLGGVIVGEIQRDRDLRPNRLGNGLAVLAGQREGDLRASGVQRGVKAPQDPNPLRQWALGPGGLG